MNHSLIIGNLVRDVDSRQTSSGISVCTFTVAVRRPHDKEKKTDFFNIVAWRGLAENCAKFISKGSKVAVSGTMQNRDYEAKDGTKRYIMEIVADEVEFLDTRKVSEEIPDEDLPF